MVTTKELKQYRSICNEIEEIDIKLKSNSDNSVVNGSMSVFPFVQHLIKIEGLADNSSNKTLIIRLGEIRQKKERIEHFINNIDDSLTRRIFEYRYITGRYKMTWERIASLIGGGNTADGVRKQHERYLEKILKK